MTQASAPDAPARRGEAVAAGRSLQLDLFRGVAAIFMIVNHAAYQLLQLAATSGGWPTWLVFVGSAAPALFFFATGVGSGFGSGRPDAISSVARKVALLLLADMLMNWSVGTWLGLDFFGFAAVATIVLFLIRQTRHPVLTTVILLAVVLIARFGIVPFARGRIEEDTVLAFITGIAPVRHVSYPLGPWLAFPLLGFLVGRRWRQVVPREEAAVVATAASLLLGAFALLAARGAPVFRWGSVSIAYFLCAMGIVATAWLATRWLAQVAPALARALALRGPASLLMVPLHYAALGLLEALAPPPWSLAAWLPGIILLTSGILLSSRALVAAARQVAIPGTIVQLLIGATACFVALASVCCATPLLRLEACSLGEVVMGLLLLWSSGPAHGDLASARRRSMEAS